MYSICIQCKYKTSICNPPVSVISLYVSDTIACEALMSNLILKNFSLILINSSKIERII